MPLDRRKYLRPDEVEALLGSTENAAILARARGHRVPVRDHALFTVALSGGLRASELADLDRGDLHLGRGLCHLFVRKGKGGKSREVALPRALKPFLNEYLAWMESAGLSTESTAPLFPGRTGQRMTRCGIWRRWKAALAAAGLPGDRPLHATRHTAAVMLYRATRDLRLVQKQLGHSSVTTTQIYADVLPEDVQAGVDAAWEGNAA